MSNTRAVFSEDPSAGNMGHPRNSLPPDVYSQIVAEARRVELAVLTAAAAAKAAVPPAKNRTMRHVVDIGALVEELTARRAVPTALLVASTAARNAAIMASDAEAYAANFRSNPWNAANANLYALNAMKLEDASCIAHAAADASHSAYEATARNVPDVAGAAEMALTAFQAASTAVQAATVVYEAMGAQQKSRWSWQKWHAALRGAGSRKVLALAARMLPGRHHARYREEWANQLHELKTRRARAAFALHLLLAGAPRLAWTLRQPSRGDVVTESSAKHAQPPSKSRSLLRFRAFVIGSAALVVGLFVGIPAGVTAGVAIRSVAPTIACILVGLAAGIGAAAVAGLTAARHLDDLMPDASEDQP